MPELNETHDPTINSWIDSSIPGSDFPIQNLPFCVFRRKAADDSFRVGVGIGDQILDVGVAQTAGSFSGDAARAAAACEGGALNGLMAMGPAAWSALRLALSQALRRESPLADKLRGSLIAQSEAEYAVPAQIGDYTDFYTSIHHATTVGKLFRPDNPLFPNYKHVPIGYHGRSSSIGVSGQRFRRPRGQVLPGGAQAPEFAASRRLDYELELGIFIGAGNALGMPIPITEVESHVFGLCILNDWSARDIQAWEYQPLGPFLSKNFASTISPWIVTLEALAPYRVPRYRPQGDPQPLPYLESASNRSGGAIDIQLQVLLETAKMRDKGQAPHQLCLTSYRHAYWTLSQMVAHHTVNGCNLRPGDLLGTGTLSGPGPSEAGSLLELTLGGKQPLSLPSGETRAFLEDGDDIVIRAWCEKPGYARIGFGEVSGRVLPALSL